MKKFSNIIKCVIWDLDDTLWDGTLAEGDQVRLRPAMAALVARLDEKGIVNSICSKNDLATARAALERLGLWSRFVFPAIDFAPKGQTIQALVASLQLRPANVLFVDDNHANRREATYYNPEIMVADPNEEDFVPSLNQVIAAASGTSRLEQYRVLERKREARRTFSSNAGFLRDSGITVSLLRNPADLTFKHRIVELVNRANQLNFTKTRFPSAAHFDDYVERANIVHGCVFAYDRYGDYGLVGFFAFDESTRKPSLEHFVFSCRIMNMGIEQAVHAELRRQFGLQPCAAVPVQTEDSSGVLVRHGLDDHLQEYVKTKMDVPEHFRSAIIAGCTSGVIDHYLPAELRPARYDLFHLPDGERKIAGVDAIIYAVYGDYGSDAWEREAFSYQAFHKHLETFLEANIQNQIVLLLASEHPFPRGRRLSLCERIRGWLSDIYRGKTRRRMLRCNAVVREVCRSRADVVLINSGDFVLDPSEQIDPRHFARVVIQRICESLPGILSGRQPDSPTLRVARLAPGRNLPTHHEIGLAV